MYKNVRKVLVCEQEYDSVILNLTSSVYSILKLQGL